MRRFQPYIGVTGFMSSDEIQRVLSEMPLAITRKLMVGVLASSKTLAGGTNKWPNRYPPVEAIADIFVDSARVVNLIHYATDDQETLGDQLKKLELLGGSNLHGFQVNVAWPDPKQMFIPKNPNGRMVLQINRRALAEVGNDPVRVVELIRRYDREGVITDILFDTSGGRGIPLSVNNARDQIHEIRCMDHDVLMDLGIGVAGGLDAATVGNLAPLFDEFPYLSVDAEGRLRTTEGDHLDHWLALDYVRAAVVVSEK